MSQQFDTLDVARLQVQEPWAGLPNLIPNPSGEYGAWSWKAKNTVTPIAGGLRLTPLPFGGAATAQIPIAKVTAVGQSIRARVTLPAASGLSSLRTVFLEVLADGSLNTISSVTVNDPGGAYPHNIVVPVTAVPVNTQVIQYQVLSNDPGGPPTATPVDFTDCVLIVGATATVTAATLELAPAWVDILGETHDLTIERDELDLGTLTGTVIGASLDPASIDLIRPGRNCRLQVLVSAVWEDLFNGTLDDPSAAYLLKDPKLPDEKRTVIKLAASDPGAILANTPRPDGVGTIDELRAVLFDAAVPWTVNGSTTGVDLDLVVVVARNENASALDQIAITRDSALGYAWVDRNGTLQAWDSATLPTSTAAAIDENNYSDLDVDFDLSKVFNVLLIKLLRINPGTGETEEITYGPFVDDASARAWKRRQATFTVQGIDEADIPAYAATILAANSTPAKRIKSLTIPFRTVTELEDNVLRDLYDLVELSNTRAGIVSDDARITSVKHRLTSEGGGQWAMDLGFVADGVVATPQVTPSPVPSGGKTLAQLLRPVGEVTMWFGAKVDCPVGWLVMDGTAIPAQYTDLIALVGANLPNMTDRFPIGAGTKALATTGGAATKVLVAANLPPHAHTIAHTHGPNGADQFLANDTAGTANRANGTGFHAKGVAVTSAPSNANSGNGPGTSTAVDILNPWLSMWFIIRAA